MLYPSSFDISRLSHKQLQLKIARHSVCPICRPPCPGLRPPRHIILTSDEDKHFVNVNNYDSQYLDSCACGHSCAEHGADIGKLGHTEFSRKARVAIRADELLQVRASTLNAWKLLISLHSTHSTENMRLPGLYCREVSMCL